MQHVESNGRTGWLRGLASAGVVALGLASIVGSGGGSSAFLSDCPPGVDCSAPPPQLSLAITRPHVTAQVGSAATYATQAAHFTGTPAYQWSRSADAGVTYVDIPGATASTYSIASVNLGDDGAMFQVVAHSGAQSANAVSHLAVSSQPPVVFEDGEFLDADWLATPLADANEPAPVQTSQRLTTGGQPGAYRKMVYTLPSQALAGRVLYESLVSTYDPQAQGAIYVIDYAEDGISLQDNTSTSTESGLLIEQAGRTYVSTAGAETLAYLTTSWSAINSRASLQARDLGQVAGPACASNEACPDFSALGSPMRFGYWRISYGTQGQVIAHGIDNWKVSVWGR